MISSVVGPALVGVEIAVQLLTESPARLSR